MAKKTCAILQPHYLPWIGYFEMIDRVDIFVFLDDVQFIKREWKNRNRIRKTPDHADSKWLTVPIRREDQHGPLNQAHLFNDEDWVTTHLNAIRGSYHRAPYFECFFPALEATMGKYSNSVLSELNIAMINWLCDQLGIKTECIKSSELSVPGKREYKLLNILKAVNADFYLANNATATYVDEEFFEKYNIGFATQDYEYPEYHQFSASKLLTQISHLSVIDLFFNVAPGGEALNLIRQGCPDNDWRKN
jgi:hypothetical protein